MQLPYAPLHFGNAAPTLLRSFPRKRESRGHVYKADSNERVCKTKTPGGFPPGALFTQP